MNFHDDLKKRLTGKFVPGQKRWRVQQRNKIETSWCISLSDIWVGIRRARMLQSTEPWPGFLRTFIRLEGRCFSMQSAKWTPTLSAWNPRISRQSKTYDRITRRKSHVYCHLITVGPGLYSWSADFRINDEAIFFETSASSSRNEVQYTFIDHCISKK